MDGVLTYNQALDIELSRDVEVDMQRMSMLAELYFADARPQFADLMKYRDLAADVQHQFREKHRRDGEPSALFVGSA